MLLTAADPAAGPAGPLATRLADRVADRVTGRVTGLPAEPPLVPTPDEARETLQRELVDPRYHQQDLLGQVLDFLDRALQNGLDRAAEASVASTLAAMVILVALLAALAWLASRARRTARAARERGAAVLVERVDADRLRERAVRARDAGRLDEALVEAFRALARRQVERGLLLDDPGATAREVALALGASRPDARERVLRAAERFDAVLYGGRPATREQVDDVLGLDDVLVAAR